MSKRKEVQLSEILELQSLLREIEYPNVTYNDDILVMAQQAIRMSRRYAAYAANILYKWTGQEVIRS